MFHLLKNSILLLLRVGTNLTVFSYSESERILGGRMKKLWPQFQLDVVLEILQKQTLSWVLFEILQTQILKLKTMKLSS